MLFDDLYIYTLVEQLKKKLLDSIDGSYFIEFRERHFELLSAEIKSKIRRKISSSTLKRIIRYGLSYTGNNDKRRLKSLDILSMFLDYESWQNFVQQNGFNIDVQPFTRKIQLINVERNLIKKSILALNDTEFRLLKKLPSINTKSLLPFFVKQDIELQNFIDLLHYKKKQNLALVPNNKICKYEISIGEIEFLDDKIALVNVSQRRELSWLHIPTLLDAEYFMIEGKKMYLMRKIGKSWFIDSSLFDNLRASRDEDEYNKFWVEIKRNNAPGVPGLGKAMKPSY